MPSDSTQAFPFPVPLSHSFQNIQLKEYDSDQIVSVWCETLREHCYAVIEMMASGFEGCQDWSQSKIKGCWPFVLILSSIEPQISFMCGTDIDTKAKPKAPWKQTNIEFGQKLQTAGSS